jgi:hypothetical protein
VNAEFEYDIAAVSACTAADASLAFGLYLMDRPVGPPGAFLSLRVKSQRLGQFSRAQAGIPRESVNAVRLTNASVLW